jgi:drug/metabolite transporter (DMT)-like permease
VIVPLAIMLISVAIVCVASVILYNGSLVTVLDFCDRHPEFIADLFYLCAFSAIGQVFVFLTSALLFLLCLMSLSLHSYYLLLCFLSPVANFGAIQLTIITTVRKFLTILASIVLFHHHLSFEQYVAVAMVFAGTVYHTYDSITTPHEHKGAKVDKKDGGGNVSSNHERHDKQL